MSSGAALRVDETPRIIDVIDGQFSIQSRFSLSARVSCTCLRLMNEGAGHKLIITWC